MSPFKRMKFDTKGNKCLNKHLVKVLKTRGYKQKAHQILMENQQIPPRYFYTQLNGKWVYGYSSDSFNEKPFKEVSLIKTREFITKHYEKIITLNKEDR